MARRHPDRHRRARRPATVRVAPAPGPTPATPIARRREPPNDDLVLLPGHGDLLVMGGRCQRDWLHGIPAVDTAEPRVSLTWRWTLAPRSSRHRSDLLRGSSVQRSAPAARLPACQHEPVTDTITSSFPARSTAEPADPETRLVLAALDGLLADHDPTGADARRLPWRPLRRRVGLGPLPCRLRWTRRAARTQPVGRAPPARRRRRPHRSLDVLHGSGRPDDRHPRHRRAEAPLPASDVHRRGEAGASCSRSRAPGPISPDSRVEPSATVTNGS